MTAHKRPTFIRVGEAALCPDCQVLFSITNAVCPVCDGSTFYLIEKRAPIQTPENVEAASLQAASERK